MSHGDWEVRQFFGDRRVILPQFPYQYNGTICHHILFCKLCARRGVAHENWS